MRRQKLVMGNWKMNGAGDANRNLVRDLMLDAGKTPAVEIVVCPPAVYLESVSIQLRGSTIGLGAQNLADQTKPGAYTGEILGSMLKDVGCSYVLVGHSERRAYYGDSDAVVSSKFRAAQAFGLTPVLCLGETLQEREQAQTQAVVLRQLTTVLDAAGVEAFKSAVIAYEPVWAIGTGRTATPAQAQEVHAYIRSVIAGKDAKIANSTRVLYGGSVKADNARELFANQDVDGGLIGGASLKATEFLDICAAAHSD